MLYALEEALEIMENRWGHANAPHDPDMLQVIKLIEIALTQGRKIEEKQVRTNQELIDLLRKETES